MIDARRRDRPDPAKPGVADTHSIARSTIYRSTLLGALLLAGASIGPAGAQDFKLASTSLSEGAPLAPAQVFEGFGCSGGNRSPQLSWSGAPAGTKSFAITAYDPDAPTGSGWWHWNAVDIPASTTAIDEGASGGPAMPAGTLEITNDYGAKGFGGACPPPGEVHRYVFTVHALSTERLDLPADPTNALTGYMIGANEIARARITAVFTR